MSEQPEIIQLVAAWQSNLPDKERSMTALDSCLEQWMQLERDKYELRKRINNHIRDMTSWQKTLNVLW